jgi:tetratricopeptide (TPR) repeat protein
MTAEETYQDLLETHGIEFGIKRREKIIKAAEDFPDHSGIQATEIDRILFTGAVDKAKERLALCLKKDPDSIKLLAAKGLIMVFDGDFIGGIEALETVRAADPTNIIMLSNLPAAYVQNGQEAKARDLMEDAMRLLPKDPDIMASMCTGYMLIEDLDSARAIEEKFRDDPGHRFCVIRARMAIKEHDMPTSEKWAREAIARNPESYAAWEHLSMLLVHNGELQEAKAAANFALELNSRSVVSLRNLVKISTREGDKVAALEFEKRANDAVPFMKDMQKLRAALALMKSGKAAEAASAYHALLNVTSISTQKQARQGLLQVLCMGKAIKDGPTYIEQIESQSVSNPLFYRAKAMVQMGEGMPDKAFATFDEGLLMFPNSLEILAGRLDCLSKTNDLPGVKHLAEEILATGINTPSEYIGVIIPLLNSNETDLVDKLYQQLIRKFPSSSAIQMVESMVAIHKGDIKGGIEKMRALSERGEMPQIRVGCLSLVKVLGKLVGRVILVKLGLRKRKGPKN